MTIKVKYLLLLILLFPLTNLLKGQEYILPLASDPGRSEIPIFGLKKATKPDTIELPFIDDFSYSHSYPNFNLWTDDYAYINRNYGFEAPSIGVATMDALDRAGNVYPFATISPETFDADFLTSQPINLEFSPSDSIYLSFYYQPVINENEENTQPNPGDSLCLDFYDVETNTWMNVWRTDPDTVKQFQLVMIPLKDERFLKNGFRFGFRNKASLPKNNDYPDKRGNVDLWNIDYVVLDKNRSIHDTVFRDVAFTSPISSMLKNYQSIPWDHFEAAYNSTYLPYFRIEYTNNDSIIRNVTRSIQVYDEVWGDLYKPNNTSAQDIFPNTKISHQITSIYPFDFGRGDTASFKIKAWLRTDDFDRKSNDTITRTQVFRDYFAYDDGSAEQGYGLRGQGSENGLVAVRFNSFIPDELGGMNLYFTQLKDSINLNYYFKLVVWDDVNGMPGNIIYQSTQDYKVLYSDENNHFIRFNFERTVPVNGIFYAGLLQYNKYMLNIGLDVNTNPNSNLLYNIGQGWQVSSAPGNLMLRPFVKRTYSSDNLKEIDNPECTLWPNPVKTNLNISFTGINPSETLQIKIYNSAGSLVKSIITDSRQIDVSDLENGLFIISITDNDRLFNTQKFIISK